MYSKYVQDGGLDGAIEFITGYYDSESWSSVSLAAACHHFVSERIDDVQETTSVERGFGRVEDVKSFSELVKEGGNCCDKSIMLASLFSCVTGVEARFVEVSRRPVGHVLLQVWFSSCSPREAVRELRSFYARNRVVRIRREAFEDLPSDTGVEFWVIADPSLARYICDYKVLEEEGFLDVDEGLDSVSWKHPVRKERV